VLTHADKHKQTLSKSTQEENTEENLGDIADHKVIEETVPHTGLTPVKTGKKKKKLKRQSVVALWQSVMFSQYGWQEKLSEEDFVLPQLKMEKAFIR